MDYLGPTLTVLAILVAVAVAAVSFKPANPLQAWHRLAERYGTNDLPGDVQYSAQSVRFGDERGGLHALNPFVRFDATIDEYGLWLVGRGSESQEVQAAIRVPGTHVRPSSKRGRGYVFELYAEPPVRIAVGNDLGSALMQKLQPLNPT